MNGFPELIQHPSGREMSLVRHRVLVRLRRTPEAATADLDRLGLEPEAEAHPGATHARGARPRRVNASQGRRWLKTRDGGAVNWDGLTQLASRADSSVEWAAPVYRIALNGGEDFLALVPNALLVAVQPGADEKASALFKQLGLAEETRRRLPGGLRYLRSTSAKQTIFELTTQLRDAGDVVRDVRFETIPMYVPTAYVPNDPLYADQWDMEQIRAGGAGQTGWNLERGDQSVILCILDEGCDLTHPDLGFTPAPSGINLGTMGGDGSPTGNHGTACAGLAAARIGNNEGVAGVAGGCTILPVAFDTWSDVEVAAGLQYAADHGARVISMSFGWDAWDHAIIDPAIQYAFDAGVVMCEATHNDNADIRYPATNPLIIAVGASDEADGRKNPTSPDGEWWWGSNFGPEISVVAPGVHCPTTDRQGSAGYNTAAGAAGNYFMTFNGTSAATPHVAGLAALLVSIDTSLTNVEVRAIIESTADKVGPVAYAVEAGHPNGTWNEEMGYGRINVLEAVRVVKKRCDVDMKRFILDGKRPFIEDKPIVVDRPMKLERFKEKERVDEIKGNIGYENPEFDPHIYEDLRRRLDRVEGALEQGQPFIRPAQRPPVGRELARRARRRG